MNNLFGTNKDIKLMTQNELDSQVQENCKSNQKGMGMIVALLILGIAAMVSMSSPTTTKGKVAKWGSIAVIAVIIFELFYSEINAYKMLTQDCSKLKYDGLKIN